MGHGLEEAELQTALLKEAKARRVIVLHNFIVGVKVELQRRDQKKLYNWKY